MSENTKCSKWRKGLLAAMVLLLAALVLFAFGRMILTADQSTPSLQLVIMISRHGNSGPLTTYPLFPKPDQDVWPKGPEELTEKGFSQMLRLGKKVRSMYDGFLSLRYNPEEFKAFASEANITVTSAQALLLTLLPPDFSQVGVIDLLRENVPVYKHDKDHVKYFQSLDDSETTRCPRFHEARVEAVRKFNQENGANISQLLEPLEAFTGLTPSADNSQALSTLWETLGSLATEGRPIPSWAEKVYPQPLTRLGSGLDKANLVGSDVNARLLSGFLFQEITGYIKSKMSGSLKPNRRMFYYSGHDSTIWGLQTILGLEDEVFETIAPSSALILELYQDDLTTDYTVQVKYLDGSSPDLEARPVVIPGCVSPCYFHQVVDITRRFGDLKDFDTECRLSG